MRDIAMLFTWLVLIPIAFSRPYIGVLLWVWTVLFAPSFEVYSFMSAVPFNKIIAAVTIIVIFMFRGGRRINFDTTLLLMLLFLGHGLLSYSLAADNAAGAFVADKMWKIALLCVFINMLITDRLRLHALVWIVVISGGFHGVVEGLKFLATAGSYHIGNVPSLGDNNYVAVGLLMLMPLSFYLWQHSTRDVTRYACLVTTLLTVFGVLATYSRGGFVGLVAVGVTLVMTGRRKLRSLLFLASLATLIVLVGPAQWFARVSSVETATADSSFMSRVFMWNMSYLIAKDHPLFGDGYYATQNRPIFHKYQSEANAIGGHDADMTLASHSIYFEALADQGFVGLALFIALLIAGFQNARVVMRFTKSRPDLRWIYDLAHMFRLSLIGFAVAGASVSATYMEFYYVELSMLAILARFCRQFAAETRDAENLDNVARLSASPLALRG